MRSNTCCTRYVLSQEEDFMVREESSDEVVERVGFNVTFYPKYHCELNFIELVCEKAFIDVFVHTIIKISKPFYRHC